MIGFTDHNLTFVEENDEQREEFQLTTKKADIELRSFCTNRRDKAYTWNMI